MELGTVKRKAALYSVVRSDRDALAVTLMGYLCASYGWDHATYIDAKVSRSGSVSTWNWDRLLDDIAKGLYDIVLLWQEVPGLEDYCNRYNTRLELVDPLRYR